MAEELGISEEDLTRSEQAVLHQKQLQDDRKAYRRFKRREFLSSFTTYVVVNLALFGFDLAKDHVINWAFYPMLGWGIGVAIKFVNTFLESPAHELASIKKWNAELAYANLPEDQQRVLDRVAQGGLPRLEAVKALHDECGLSLREAHSRVEAYLVLHPGTLA